MISIPNREYSTAFSVGCRTHRHLRYIGVSTCSGLARNSHPHNNQIRICFLIACEFTHGSIRWSITVSCRTSDARRHELGCHGMFSSENVTISAFCSIPWDADSRFNANAPKKYISSTRTIKGLTLMLGIHLHMMLGLSRISRRPTSTNLDGVGRLLQVRDIDTVCIDSRLHLNEYQKFGQSNQVTQAKRRVYS